MHTHTRLGNILCSTIYFASFALAGNYSQSIRTKYAAYPWLFDDPENPSFNNTDALGATADRKYTCLNQKSIDEGARAKDCLAGLLRLPQDADMFDYIPRNDEDGFIPTELWQDRCYIRLMYTDDTVRQERSNWLYMMNAATALINLCKRGGEHKVQGTVAFGEQGLLRLVILKAPPKAPNGANVQPDFRKVLDDARRKGLMAGNDFGNQTLGDYPEGDDEDFEPDARVNRTITAV